MEQDSTTCFLEELILNKKIQIASKQRFLKRKAYKILIRRKLEWSVNTKSRHQEKEYYLE